MNTVVQDIKKLASEVRVSNFGYGPRPANNMVNHIAQGLRCLSINHTLETYYTIC